MNRFDKIADIWEAKPARLANAKTVYEKISGRINFSNYKNVLDYGTGTGLLLIHIQPFVNKITGYDNSKGMLLQLENKVKAAKFSNVFTSLHDADVDKLPENEFDLFVSSMTFHHIKNVEIFIKNAYSALQEGGKFFVADLESEDGTFHSGDNQGIHHFGFNKNEFKRMMENAGFKNCKVETIFCINKEEKEYPLFLAAAEK